MASDGFRTHEDVQRRLIELEKIRLGTEVPFGQMFEAICFKVKWSLTKRCCYALQRYFPEFDLHCRLLKVALVELESVEYL
jgi:hypothetical protein